DVARYAGLAHLKVVDEPVIAFGKGTDGPEVAVRCRYDREFSVDFHPTRIGQTPRLEWNPETRGASQIDALIDLVYLARHYPQLLDSSVAGRLRELIPAATRRRPLNLDS